MTHEHDWKFVGIVKCGDFTQHKIELCRGCGKAKSETAYWPFGFQTPDEFWENWGDAVQEAGRS